MATTSPSTKTFKTIDVLDCDAIYLALQYRERRDDNEAYHWAFVQFADSDCSEIVYMNAENEDLRLDTDNWKYIERYEWKPAESKSLVVLYELQVPDGVGSEDVYGMIHSKGREVIRKKSDYRRFHGQFNCRIWLYEVLEYLSERGYVTLHANASDIMTSAKEAAVARHSNFGRRNRYTIVTYST